MAVHACSHGEEPIDLYEIIRRRYERASTIIEITGHPYRNPPRGRDGKGRPS